MRARARAVGTAIQRPSGALEGASYGAPALTRNPGTVRGCCSAKVITNGEATRLREAQRDPSA